MEKVEKICKYCQNLRIMFISPTSKQYCVKCCDYVDLEYTCSYWKLDELLKHKWDRFELSVDRIIIKNYFARRLNEQQERINDYDECVI